MIISEEDAAKIRKIAHQTPIMELFECMIASISDSERKELFEILAEDYCLRCGREKDGAMRCSWCNDE